jgi:hypothetical protein
MGGNFMIVEMRTYTLKPGTIAEYLKLYEEKGLEVHRRILGTLIGYFTTEIGNINEAVHLWGYVSFEDRQIRRNMLAANEEWQQFLRSALPYLEKQENKVLLGTSFSPIK